MLHTLHYLLLTPLLAFILILPITAKEITQQSHNKMTTKFVPIFVGSIISIVVMDNESASDNEPISTGAITHNGTTYGTVTSPYTGKVWLDRNLGAARVCESFDDVACYGDYYQWGRNFDGHQDSTSATSTTQATDVNTAGSNFITQSYDWANAADSEDSDGSLRSTNWSKTDGSSVCPVGYRVPIITELRAEILDNGATNRDAAFANFLKLPLAGYRSYFGGSIGDVGSWGNVWSSSASASPSSALYFHSGNAGWSGGVRASGYSVRCLRD